MKNLISDIFSKVCMHAELQVFFVMGICYAARDAYIGISNPMDSNPSVYKSKNLSFFEYLDSK